MKTTYPKLAASFTKLARATAKAERKLHPRKAYLRHRGCEVIACDDDGRLDRHIDYLDLKGLSGKKIKAMVEGMLANDDAGEIKTVFLSGGLDYFDSLHDMLNDYDYEPMIECYDIEFNPHTMEVVLTNEEIDSLVRKHTAFKNLEDMTNTHENYRPSICVGPAGIEHNDNKFERKAIADAYDAMMEKRGDERRAFRYGA